MNSNQNKKILLNLGFSHPLRSKLQCCHLFLDFFYLQSELSNYFFGQQLWLYHQIWLILLVKSFSKYQTTLSARRSARSAEETLANTNENLIKRRNRNDVKPKSTNLFFKSVGDNGKRRRGQIHRRTEMQNREQRE